MEALLKAMLEDCERGASSLPSAIEKARAIAAIGGQQAVDLLISEMECLDDEDHERDMAFDEPGWGEAELGEKLYCTSQALATALGEMRPAPVDVLLTYLQALPGISDCAAHALSLAGDLRAVEPMLALVDHRGTSVSVAQALGRLGDASAVPALLGVLEVRLDDWNARRGDRLWVICATAEALGRIGDERAIGPLSKLLATDRNHSKRLAAVEALAAIGRPAAMESLWRALGDEQWQVSEAAAAALEKWNASQPGA